ncbi:MAG TPA: hypothetical protein ENK13_01895, partial [Thermopetrobacter sp.]|nr:hypothetical protein [Thermopetrobacter sp.]
MAMIVSCPSCATTYRLADGEEPADGELIRCAGCGHSWLEASARGMEKRTGAAPGGAAGSVHEMRESMLHEAGGAEASPAEDADDPDAALLLPVPLAREEMAGFDDMSGGLDDEAAILAREALAAEQERRRRMAARRRERLRWAALILFLVVGGGLLWSYPDAVSRHLPGMARLYAMAGIEVNPRGFDIATVRA